MLPALQPSRPKPPQQRPQPTFAQQQRRAAHDDPRPVAQPQPPQNDARLSQPRSQLEAMPPLGPGTPLLPPRGLYESAVRHPVFFTEQLKKPPFPIPGVAGHGWSPVAAGYILEQRRAETNGVPKTKL